MKERILLKGEKVSIGIGVGRLFFIDRDFAKIPHLSLQDKKEIIDAEVDRFLSAVDMCSRELEKVIDELDVESEIKSILEAHMMMITDETFIKSITDTIEKKKINSEWAVISVIQPMVNHLVASDSSYYLKAKAADLNVIRDKIISSLISGSVSATFTKNLPEEDFILGASNISVSELNYLSKNENFKGIVLEAPGGVSHLTVVIRALEIPAVLGIPDLVKELDFRDIIIVDGGNGEVVLRPSEKEITEAKKKRKRLEKYFAKFMSDASEPSVSKDGRVLKVGGNIDQTGEIEFVKKNGGEFIGLFRTELMFLDRSDIPSEEEHYQIYYQTLHRALPLRATIRIFDFGEDKNGRIASKGFMGMRGIRLCKTRPDVFIPQIRGLVRAAGLGNLNILLPFVSTVHEVDFFKEMLFKEADSMGLRKNLANVKTGAMIEVPSAVFIAEQLAREVDFFSVGTNDLIQYMMAVERKDQFSSEYFSHYHPAIIRVLFQLVHVAKEQDREISICGEMASDPYLGLVFLAMGVSSLSMTPVAIPIMKKIIRSGFVSEGETLLRKMLLSSEKEEVVKILKEYMTNRYPNVFTSEWNNN
ncbi:MAG TPA: phosphoenolpyruvate--protein phosphotransferase [bacterium]|nr:phosphoenolpyruvate--protein phosphotransferase [bacterium]HPS29246.1 phosphoenolpyruvate--protein phosphotransferase [bacterium]